MLVTLRQYGFRPFDDAAVTEQIYIHSKLMIVDDRRVMCGSANINDRSMNGRRDSEICLLIEDGEMSDDKQVSVFAHNLRIKLWRQHLSV